MDLLPVFTVAGVVISSAAAVIAAFYSYKDNQTNNRNNAVQHDQIQEVHLSLNSRLDQLLKAAEAQGRLHGAAEARANDKMVRDTVQQGQ